MHRVARITFVILSLFLVFSQKQATADLLNWQSSIPLPHELASSVSYSYNNYLYSFGGATDAVIPQQYKSKINNDGSLNSWNVSAFYSIYWHSLASKNENVYILGGQNFPFSGYYQNVYLGKITTGGNITQWQTLSSLPNGSSLGAAVVAQNRLYYAGGFNNNGVSNDVYVADINSDGTISSWSIAGHLPEPLQGFGMVAHEDKIIIIGGKTQLQSGTVPTTRVAQLHPDGTIASWITSENLPEGLHRPGIAQYGDYIIVAGGLNEIHISSSVYYSKIQSDGSLSSWTTSDKSLPRPNCCSPLVRAGEYLYLLGGHDGVNYFSDVLTIPVSSIISTDLSVPLFKQTDLEWSNQIYDRADIWSPSDPSISAWGCALTSAAMVFNYHGITKLPDANSLNPGTLNTWLKNQPDGYIRNGLVNWLALTRLSKSAKQSGNNPGFIYDALEYSRVTTSMANQLKEDLDNNIPGILEVPGHFIVAKGVQDNTFTINDPYYSYSTLADGYSNTFLTLNRFVPSHTDLSYFLIIGENSLAFNIKNNNGENIGNTFTQEPLHNEADPNNKSGESLSQLLFKNPASGEYRMTLSSTKTSPYTIDLYLYDVNGEPYQKTISGFISKNNNEAINLSYNHDLINNSNVYKNVTFETIIRDINEAKSLKLIKKGYDASLLSLMKGAQKSKNRTMKIKTLDGVLTTLKLSKDRLIEEEAYTILFHDITQLRNSL